MSDPAFFGYGSLVNTRTHDYPAREPVTLTGWRRIWQRTKFRDVVFLSVEPDPAGEIDGLIAAVPNADWTALDAREHGYDRVAINAALGTDRPTALYQVPQRNLTVRPCHILRSYLDVVVQGYLHQFGRDGVTRFFATTSGWDTPIVDDRADPIYPRAQVLTPDETALVDHHLAAQGKHLE